MLLAFMSTKYLLFLHGLVTSPTSKYSRCPVIVTCPKIKLITEILNLSIIGRPWCKQNELHVFGDTEMCMNTWTPLFNLTIL
jgi:hypothetical protein